MHFSTLFQKYICESYYIVKFRLKYGYHNQKNFQNKH